MNHSRQRGKHKLIDNLKELPEYKQKELITAINTIMIETK